MILSGAHVGDDYPDGKGVLPSEWCAFSGRGRRSGKWLRLMAVPPLTPAGTLARPSFTNSFNNAGTRVNRKEPPEPQSVRDEPPSFDSSGLTRLQERDWKSEGRRFDPAPGHLYLYLPPMGSPNQAGAPH